MSIDVLQERIRKLKCPIMVGLDAALKAAEVRLTELYRPPTETNFAGGLLTGTQSACRAACDAFAQAVCAVAANPRESGFRA